MKINSLNSVAILTGTWKSGIPRLSRCCSKFVKEIKADIRGPPRKKPKKICDTTGIIECPPEEKKPRCEALPADKQETVYDGGVDLSDRGIRAVDPCDALKSYEQPNVVIIGAGMAGISAAARLAQRGITSIAVLEAYERPGGRIHSCWLGDVVAELGAHWRPDTQYNHPIYYMSATEDPPRPGQAAAEHTRGLLNSVVTGTMPLPPSVSAYQKFRQIEKEAASIYCLGGHKQHGSLLNFISIRIQQELHEYPENQQHDAARIMFGMAHMLTARSGNDTALLGADSFGCFMNMPGGDVRVPLGLIGILAPMLCEIPEGTIHYCSPVNCIYWGTSQRNGHRAIVVTNDGTEYGADYVIVTVSLGTLWNKAVSMFCPALPASKIDAMRCLGFGCCNKVYLEYCRPFWFWQINELNYTFCEGQLCNRCDWTRGISAIEIVPHSKCVLCVWIVGQAASQVESLCDKDVAEGVTCLLRSITCNCQIPYPMTILRSHWASDPYFNGAYSYDRECSNGVAQRALGCPLPGPSEPVPPILLFAGEATVPGHFSTVAGARLSGIREAERVVQLTLRYKGLPIPVDEYSTLEERRKLCYDEPEPPKDPCLVIKELRKKSGLR